ncbi:hypothetical protein MKQ70_03880 [Chitinophaga sedimenti]|uniref:hypothetical protein n=1 Tax=Chitinophaga sedimenti TaxID=2033606 RepID=UPI0020060D68|nr:hypothetical protein [Chitinophaga sedimenti]MCK7554193.1 hypothetical protein [Chitinophaga sedimenti]
MDVEVLGADGSVLEAGSALLDTVDLLTWRYCPELADWQHVAAGIHVIASDLPGNVTTRVFLL